MGQKQQQGPGGPGGSGSGSKQYSGITAKAADTGLMEELKAKIKEKAKPDQKAKREAILRRCGCL